MLEFSGERFIPGAGSDELHHEHVHRYRFAATVAAGRRVLDLGCGEGYGAAILSGGAQRVTGVDIDREAVASASARYGDRGIEFVVAPATDVPLPDGSVDLITCFEVIEHVDDPAGLVAEVVRLLAQGGLLVCSTPDRDAYNASLTQPNPFHVCELSRAELAELLERSFDSVRLYGQRSVTASWIADDEPPALELTADRPPPSPIFWVAVAAVGAEAPHMRSSLLVDPQRQAKPERADLIDQLGRGQRQLVEYERQLADQAEAVERERALRARLEADLESVRTSISWRVTRPMRAGGELVRSLRGRS